MSAIDFFKIIAIQPIGRELLLYKDKVYLKNAIRHGIALKRKFASQIMHLTQESRDWKKAKEDESY